MLELMPHQEEAANWIASTDGDVLLKGGAGIGKSGASSKKGLICRTILQASSL